MVLVLNRQQSVFLGSANNQPGNVVNNVHREGASFKTIPGGRAYLPGLREDAPAPATRHYVKAVEIVSDYNRPREIDHQQDDGDDYSKNAGHSQSATIGRIVFV